jgi:hypothetical protein
MKPDAYIFFGVIGFMITCVGLFIWYIDRCVTKSNQEEAQHKILMDARLEEMKTKPMFKLVFEDKQGATHETKVIEPIIVSYHREWFCSSKERAGNVRKAGFELGFFTNKDGVAIPTCNILNVKVVQHVPG